MGFQVRRIRVDEWREVRDLRLEALRDPLANLAFLETYAEQVESPDEFWRERTAGGAEGSKVSQWVAEEAGRGWIGTVAVMAFHAGDTDYHGDTVAEPRANLIGVYVLPGDRGRGVLDSLIDTAASWTADQGFPFLDLEVHPDNTPAIAAYARCGFVATGRRTEGDDRGDLKMRRILP